MVPQEKMSRNTKGIMNDGLPMDASWNWPEDYDLENGQYIHKCGCGQVFHGHKRQIICGICATKDKEMVDEANVVLATVEPRTWHFMGMAGDARADLRREDYRWGYVQGYIAAKKSELIKPANPLPSLDA